MSTRDHSKETSDNKKLQCQICVVGGGASGLPAAIAAAENGAEVTLLEKRRNAGGNFNLGGGIFAAESPLQKQLGIDVRKDDLFRITVKHCHWKVDPKIVRSMINRSGDTIQWLLDRGVNFAEVGTRSKGKGC